MTIDLQRLEESSIVQFLCSISQTTDANCMVIPKVPTGKNRAHFYITPPSNKTNFTGVATILRPVQVEHNSQYILLMNMSPGNTAFIKNLDFMKMKCSSWSRTDIMK